MVEQEAQEHNDLDKWAKTNSSVAAGTASPLDRPPRAPPARRARRRCACELVETLLIVSPHAVHSTFANGVAGRLLTFLNEACCTTSQLRSCFVGFDSFTCKRLAHLKLLALDGCTPTLCNLLSRFRTAEPSAHELECSIVALYALRRFVEADDAGFVEYVVHAQGLEHLWYMQKYGHEEYSHSNNIITSRIRASAFTGWG